MKAAKFCTGREFCDCGKKSEENCRLREAYEMLRLAKKEVGNSHDFRCFCRAASVRLGFWIDEVRPRLPQRIISDVVDLIGKIAVASHHRFPAHRKADIAACVVAVEGLRTAFILDRQDKPKRRGRK